MADTQDIAGPELRIRGRWPLPPGPRVAIVGARRPTPYGEAVAGRLAGDLARAGVIVVSGLALSVEAAAHHGALEAGGCTVAVLGTGVDVVYPAANAELTARILAAGGTLVSQFPDGTRPLAGNFPQRNSTIARLCDLLVVVEAAEGSLSLITADAAIAQGRPSSGTTEIRVKGAIAGALRSMGVDGQVRLQVGGHGAPG